MAPVEGRPPLAVTRDGNVCIVTICRPEKANALDAGLVEALEQAVGYAEHDGATALVVRAEGRNFCAGFDFTGYEQQSEGDLLLRFVRIEQLLQRLRRGPLISVALVQGPAYGAGADLAAACTFRVAAPAARFRFPGFRFGVALGTRRLVQLVGAQQARSILLTGRTLAAAEAHALGLVSHLTPAAQPDALAVTQVIDLEPDARSEILRLTTEDTGAEDLAALVRSVSHPGLHGRIARYRSEAARATG